VALKQRIASKIGSLRRHNPALRLRPRADEELTHYATLCVQATILLEALENGDLDPRRLRALTETQRMVLDAGRSLGLVAAPPKAGESAGRPAARAQNYEEHMR